MSAHVANKENKLPMTNTRIGNRSPENIIYGGSYSIPDEEYGDFLKLYSKYVFDCNKPEYLTEKQRETDAAIAVDIDFRYKYDVYKRIHTSEHIDDLVFLYLEHLRTYYTHFNSFFRMSVILLFTSRKFCRTQCPPTGPGTWSYIGRCHSS